MNLIPARAGGCLMVAAAGIAQLAESVWEGIKIYHITAWAMHGKIF